MSYIIPILAVMFILACMAKRLNDEDEEEERYDDTTRYQDKVVSSIYSSLHDYAEQTHKKLTESISGNYKSVHDDTHDDSNNKSITDNDEDMNKETFDQEIKNASQNEDYSLVELLVDILIKIGCQPQIEDHDTISVKYQGETFTISVGRRVARIWDLGWYGINAGDPKLPLLKDAVNMCNFQTGPTIVLTSPNDEGMIYIHSHYDVMLHSACNENIEYLNAVLDSFFKTKDNLYRHINLMDMSNN